MINIIQYSERFLLTMWVGGMWTVGYLVAPVLFKSLESRQMAGELAGGFFQYISIIGLVCGGLLLIGVLVAEQGTCFKRWRVWVLLAMLLLVATGLFVLQPMMQELKLQGITAGTELAKQFGRLHGVSSVLYLITSVLGLVLVLMGLRTSGSQD